MTPARLQRLAAIAPELAAAADASAADWRPQSPPPTVLAGDLADALASKLELLPPSALRAAFDLCEEALVEGTEEEQAAFATGFLEALQHADRHGEFDFGAVADLLGPTSRAHCKAMDGFYGARTRGL